MTTEPGAQRGRPGQGAETSSSRPITSRLTTESHETHHDLFSLTKTGEHLVLFGLDCWFAFISHIKKEQNTIKIFL